MPNVRSGKAARRLSITSVKMNQMAADDCTAYVPVRWIMSARGVAYAAAKEAKDQAIQRLMTQDLGLYKKTIEQDRLIGVLNRVEETYPRFCTSVVQSANLADVARQFKVTREYASATRRRIKALANLLGCTPIRVAMLAATGKLPQTSRDRFEKAYR